MILVVLSSHAVDIPRMPLTHTHYMPESDPMALVILDASLSCSARFPALIHKVSDWHRTTPTPSCLHLHPIALITPIVPAA